MQHSVLKNTTQFDIILASASPRRKELLEQTGMAFRTLVRPVSEEIPEGLIPVDAVKHLARTKSDMFNQELAQPGTILITADTIVVADGVILNKPADSKEAYDMLRLLSGKWHEVHTGVCIRSRDYTNVFHDTTRVHFKNLSDDAIRYYIDCFQPFDKAGAYGIQEWIGLIGIDAIEGSYPNVIGLPVHLVYQEICDLTDRLIL